MLDAFHKWSPVLSAALQNMYSLHWASESHGGFCNLSKATEPGVSRARLAIHPGSSLFFHPPLWVLRPTEAWGGDFEGEEKDKKGIEIREQSLFGQSSFPESPATRPFPAPVITSPWLASQPGLLCWNPSELSCSRVLQEGGRSVCMLGRLPRGDCGKEGEWFGRALKRSQEEEEKQNPV